MKSNHIIFLLLLLLVTAFGFIACQKNINPDAPSIEPPSAITASVSGRVTDDSHMPVEGALIKSGTASTTTDLNGFFRFKNINIADASLAFVKVEKDGFFTGSRTYQCLPGSNSYVAVQLIKKIAVGTFNSSAGGSVTLSGNTGKIDFPANGIMQVSGNAAYSGTVTVSAFYINPASTDFQEIMPGALLGTTMGNDRVGLQSFGMLAVELTGAGNEKLQLVTGKTAAVTVLIPAELQSKAPVSIPLWSFSDSTGLWKEEGTAIRQGNSYVGTVSHFSFWNCDFPFPIITFKGTVINQDNLPIANVKVLIKTTDDATSTYGFGYTDSAGLIMGSVPANKTLSLTIFNKCGTVILNKNIGPFTGSANLGNLLINTSAGTMVQFSGTVVNCLNTPVANGVVKIFMENVYYNVQVVNGSFSMTVSRCNSNATTAAVFALDIDNAVQGSPVQIPVAGTPILTGVLKACGNSTSEHMSYTLNGITTVFSSPADSISFSKDQNGKYELWFSRKTFPGPREEVNLEFAATGTGTTPLTSVTIYQNSSFFSLSAPATITITEHGGVGEFISGNFTADLKKDTAATRLPVTANFRFKRTY